MESLKIKLPYTDNKKHCLFQIEKDIRLPTVVFFGGVHGNEKAGVKALEYVYNTMNISLLNGNIYGILGNVNALDKGERYLDEDLNRLWTKEKIKEILSKTSVNNEELQLQHLFELLGQILKKNKGPFYFIDLHTTSSQSLPFITINDALINREFSKLFPVPIVLGIEEYLEGALLSYINTLGYVSIGFESGQHTDFRSIKNNIAFIQLALVFSGILEKKNTDVKGYLKVLKSASEGSDRFYEIIHLFKISNDDNFKMELGFKSFQPIIKGTHIATYNDTKINSNFTGNIFMPLYQKKGGEGFFIIKPILPFFLFLSRVLRRFRIDTLLVILPGISWQNKNDGVLKANLKVVQFLAKPIFHLFGFRSRTIEENKVFLYNRERVAKEGLYRNTWWFNT